MGWCDLQAELGSLPSDELDLLLAVSSPVIFCTFAEVLLTMLQHSIDQSREPMSHGGDGFRGRDRITKMKYALTQLDMRENTASSRRHASHPVERTSGPQQAISHVPEDHSESNTFGWKRNGATVERENERLLTIYQVAELLLVPVSWVYGRTRRRSTRGCPVPV
jgi:hypothetical protein